MHGGREQLLNSRQRRARCNFTGFDSLIGPPEIVPRQALHVGTNDQVRVAVPSVQLMFLRGADRAGHHLKNVLRSVAAGVLRPDRYPNDEASAKLARGLAWNRSHQSTIGQPACSELYGLKETWIRATGADRFDEGSLLEHDWIAARQVRCDDGERNSHVLELFRVEDSFNNVRQAMVAGQTETRNAPARDIAKANRSAGCENPRQWCSARVCRTKYAANAGASYVRNTDVVLFEDFKHAEMSESTRKSATESQADTGLTRVLVRRIVRKVVHNIEKCGPASGFAQWDVRIGFPVRPYLFQDCIKTHAVIPNSTEILVLYPLCTIAARSRKSHSRLCRAAVPEGAKMDTAYQPWVGQAVVLQVALGDIKVPLHGRLLKDCGETLRMRIGDGWDVDIYKTMVMAVEEDAMALIPA